MLLGEFIKTQESQMAHIKSVLVNNWVAECSTYLRE